MELETQETQVENAGEPVSVKIVDRHGEAKARFHSALKLINRQATKGYLGVIERQELLHDLLAVREYLDSNPGSAA